MPPSSASVDVRAADARPRAVLVGVQLPGVTDADHASDLAELGRLVHTLGFDVVGDRDAAARRARGGGGRSARGS